MRRISSHLTEKGRLRETRKTAENNYADVKSAAHKTNFIHLQKTVKPSPRKEQAAAARAGKDAVPAL